jgi:hypothetical protein
LDTASLPENRKLPLVAASHTDTQLITSPVAPDGHDVHDGEGVVAERVLLIIDEFQVIAFLVVSTEAFAVPAAPGPKSLPALVCSFA